MRPFLPILVLALVGLAGPTGPAQARIIINEKIRTYDVVGTSGLQLMTSVRARGARGTGMRHAMAAAISSISISARARVRDGRCVYERVVVTLNVTYRLPRWVSRRRASEGLREVWSKFYAQIYAHERQHGRIERRHAQRMEAAIYAARPRVSDGCTKNKYLVIPGQDELTARRDREQAAFDRSEGRADARVRRLERALYRMR